MSEEEKFLKEAKKLPWEDRLVHKNWKIRSEANVDLAAVCDSISDPKDPRLLEFGPLFRKTVADSNAPVQEKALDALIAFQRAADADAGRYAKEVCDAILAKCLTGRPKTVEKAQAAFLLWVELEATDVFLDAMEKAIKNKVAKAVVPAIDVVFQALSEFGAKVVPPKRILKMLPELFDHPDQNVRASSKGLTLELCRWMGKDPVKSILLEKMRDTMRKELEAELVNVTGVAKPSRRIRSEQDKQPERAGPSEVLDPGHSIEAADEDIDEYELMDPVDILTPLEKSGFWDGVKATKWLERKEAVAELTKLASTKRIAPGDFSEVTRTLKKLITDVNIAVVVEAIQAIGNLATGLRTHFSSSSCLLLPVLLEKLKEKKPTLTDALAQTLQAMHKAGCVSQEHIVDGSETLAISAMEKEENKDATDRLSELPDCIIQEILQYLPSLEEIGSTRFISKRWSHIDQYTLPVLFFDAEYWHRPFYGGYNHYTAPTRFHRYVDRIMEQLRKAKVKINKFELRLYQDHRNQVFDDLICSKKIDDWMKMALESSAEEICFGIYTLYLSGDRGSFNAKSFPASVLTAKSLKSLTICSDGLTFPDELFSVPITLPCLQRLEFCNVKLNEASIRRIIGNCPNLKELKQD